LSSAATSSSVRIVVSGSSSRGPSTWFAIVFGDNPAAVFAATLGVKVLGADRVEREIAEERDSGAAP
jgi:hypothetical protein